MYVYDSLPDSALVLASIPVENVCFQSNYNWANGQAAFSQGVV